MAEADDMLNRLPDLGYVRDQLARNLRERDLLRKLLRLAEQKTSEMELRLEGESEVDDE